ncbi:MAG: diacylglycerol O-acyltransferase [Frankiales bacterium]|nr:diacylglycerol O-acyltransferase [Frankiales bacterium]
MKRLSGWDAYLLYSETPTVHTHTLKIAVLDPRASGTVFDTDVFRQALSRRLHLLDPLRYTLVDVPLGMHHPMWRENCAVDLDHHVRSHLLAAPGDRHALDALIGRIASTQLDRTRPLWEFHVVEGLTEGRVAVVGKVHHALADGVAVANLLASAVEPGRKAVLDEHEPGPADPPPRSTEVVQAALADHVQQLRALPGVVSRTAVGAARLRRHGPPRLPGAARPLHAPATFFNRSLGAERRFASSLLPLGSAKAVSKALGVTLNDVVLSVCAGALRTLLLAVDGKADAPLVGAVPVSTDKDPTRISGNRLSGLFVSLPVHVEHPVERCLLVSRSTRTAKAQHELLGAHLLQDWMAYLPPRPAAAAFRRQSQQHSERNRILNLPISNVPGPRQLGYVAGTPISELYSVGPLYDRSGINITVWSYVDQLAVSVLSDGLLLPEPRLVNEAVQAAFTELLEATDTGP